MRCLFVWAAVLALAAGAAWAGNFGDGVSGDPPLPLDGSWAGGSVWTSGEVQTWTYTSAKPVVFKVTDAFNAGDYFDVSLDGGWIFSTPNTADYTAWVGDYDAAYADSRFSSGSAVLPAGSHSVDVAMWVDAGLPAGYAVQGTLVPEPSSLVLLGVGALGTLLPLRVRRRK